MQSSSRAKQFAGLVPWKPGQSGNPGGKLRGFNRILKELLSKRELNGEPCPGGRTVEECLAEATLLRAIKGDNNCLVQVLDRIYGPKGSIETSDGQRVVFEIIENNRDRAPEIEAKPGADGSAGSTDVTAESRL